MVPYCAQKLLGHFFDLKEGSVESRLMSIEILKLTILKIVGGAENAELLSSLKLLRGPPTLISIQHYRYYSVLYLFILTRSDKHLKYRSLDTKFTVSDLYKNGDDTWIPWSV